jgi:hypothetical protein
MLPVAAAIAVLVAMMHRAQVIYAPLIVLASIGLWFVVYESGVHATIAGVVLGLLTPARPTQTALEADEIVDLLENGEICKAENFSERCSEIWTYENHNWLRVSRVLESLRVLGLETETQAFLAWLDGAYHDGTIGSGDSGARSEAAMSLEHWIRCAKGR